MLDKLLNLIPRYRQLKADKAILSEIIESMKKRIDALAIQVESAKEVARVLSESRDNTVSELLRSTKMVSNWQAIQAGSPVVPFPDVHVEMRKPEEAPIGGPPARWPAVGARLARDVQREMVAASREQAAAAAVKYRADTLGLDDLA